MPTAESARTLVRERPKLPRARSLEQSSFTHLVPTAEVAAVGNHAVLAADDGHNFLTLPVGNALIDMGAGQDLIGRNENWTEGGRTASHDPDLEGCGRQVDVGRADIVAAVHRLGSRSRGGHDSAHFVSGHS